MTKTVILGVIGSDAHVVGITILEQALEAAGFDVVNLGVQSSQEEFVEAASANDAEAVLVSSLYGHAKQDCDGFTSELPNPTSMSRPTSAAISPSDRTTSTRRGRSSGRWASIGSLTPKPTPRRPSRP